MIRVLIVDDHAIVRKGLKSALLETDFVESVEEAENAETALSLISAKAPPFDVVSLDVSLKDGNGIELLRRIHRKRPNQRTLILSVQPEDPYAVMALRAGASGYLSKDCPVAEYVSAVSRIADRGRYISDSLAEMLAESATKPPEKKPHERLSGREYQTFLRLASGKTMSEIAEEMALSVKTISVYRAKALKKMGLKNTAELVRYAMTHGLLDV